MMDVIQKDSPGHSFWGNLCSILKPDTNLHDLNLRRLNPMIKLSPGEKEVITREFKRAQERTNSSQIHKILLELGIHYLSDQQSIQECEALTNILVQLEHFGMGQSKLAAFVHKYRALLHANHGRYTDSINDLNTAILIDPTYSGAYCNRALDRMDSFNVSGLVSIPSTAIQFVLDDVLESIRLDPTYTLPYCIRAKVHVVRGDDYQAMKDVATALSFDPYGREANDWMAFLYGRIGKNVCAYWQNSFILSSGDRDAYDKRRLRLRVKLHESSQDQLFCE